MPPMFPINESPLVLAISMSFITMPRASNALRSTAGKLPNGTTTRSIGYSDVLSEVTLSGNTKQIGWDDADFAADCQRLSSYLGKRLLLRHLDILTHSSDHPSP